MSNKKDRGNEQNGFFWILDLLKCFNGFENSHTDWIGYLNMICGEKMINWVIFEQKGFLKVWKTPWFNNCVNLFKDMLIKLKYVNVESLKNVIWADFSNFG